MWTRIKRAGRDASIGDWKQAVAVLIVSGALAAIALSLDLLTSGLPGIAVSVACGLGGLVLVWAVQYAREWRRVGRKMAFERALLSALREVINCDVRMHGPQLITLRGACRLWMVPFIPDFLAALKTLETNGEVANVQWRLAGYETTRGEWVQDPWFETVRVLAGEP